MIYLYGLLDAASGAEPDALLDGIAGVGGAVALARCGDLYLIHGPHDGREILPRRRSLLAHARVLETAMEAGTVLPMRFGMTCASRDDFAELVEKSHVDIQNALDRVKGRVEFGIRVNAPEEDALQATLDRTPELAATRDRLAKQGAAAHFAKVDFGRALGEAVAARRRAAQKTLLAELVPEAVEHILKAPDTDFEPLRAEFLVERGRMQDFSEVLERVVAELEFAGPGQCVAQMVGPGPAFHFSDLALDPSTTEEAA